jgi:hypothetical protein
VLFKWGTFFFSAKQVFFFFTIWVNHQIMISVQIQDFLLKPWLTCSKAQEAGLNDQSHPWLTDPAESHWSMHSFLNLTQWHQKMHWFIGRQTNRVAWLCGIQPAGFPSLSTSERMPLTILE